MKRFGLCMVLLICGVAIFAKNAKLTLVVSGKTIYSEYDENCSEILLSDIKGEISKISGLEGFHKLGKIVFDSVSFSKNMHFEKKTSGVKVLVMNFCSFYSLYFLRDLPSLEAVYAPFSATRFTPIYEIDLSANRNLVFFFITQMQRNTKFKRIKALPPSLEVFGASDAIFDMSNLRDLRDAGGGKLIFGLNEYTAEKVSEQGLEFANPATYQTYDQRYHLGMK